ncbi:MAG: ABC transporter substrate-binding protein [Alphaproteobacteria bacterium]|nr:ABC transporter substrate-binding protein [Alphaproteobacteria bacterium]
MRGVLLAAFAAAALQAGGANAAETPQRIAVAGSGLTEIVVALGAGDRLVGVDTTSLFPERVRRLPQLGYLRAIAAEGVLSLKPDMLLASEDAGPPAVLAQLASAGLRIVRAQEGYDPEAVVRRVAHVGEAIGRPEAARALEGEIAADLARVHAAVPRGNPPRVLFLLAAGAGAPLVAGRETAAAAMIEYAGGRNAIDGYRGYKPLSAEGAVEAAPDLVLTTDTTVRALGGMDAVRALPAFGTLAATKKLRFAEIDPVYMLGFGPRIAHAVRELARILHPDAALPELPERAWLKADR